MMPAFDPGRLEAAEALVHDCLQLGKTIAELREAAATVLQHSDDAPARRIATHIARLIDSGALK